MRAIVNYSTLEYYNGQKRLQQSLSMHSSYDAFLGFTEGLASHKENPYAFKIDAIEIAKKTYDKVLWLDASVYAVKDISPVWTWLNDKGIFMEACGHMVGNWCNDFTLNYFGITRDEAMTMPMFAAGYVGFDFTNKISIEFFERWKQSMLAGCFKGSWENHRHDMSAGSIIANQMGLVNKYSPSGQFFAYIGNGYPPPQESAVLHLQGI